MFQGSSARGFCAAGRSYLEGQWYERARAMYDRALQRDPDNKEARRQLVRLQSVPEGERPGNGGPEVPADGQENVEEPSII
jgi:hypothetical protein